MFRPNRMAANGAFLPLVFGVMSLVLVNGASMDTPVLANPLSLLCIVVCTLSALMMVIPRVFNWGWDARYFGVCVLYLGSTASVGVVKGFLLFYYYPGRIFRETGKKVYVDMTSKPDLSRM